MDEFDSSREDWEQYSQRLEYFFTANGVEESAQKTKTILLTVVGPTAFKLLS